jgi:hypothetical protein
MGQRLLVPMLMKPTGHTASQPPEAPQVPPPSSPSHAQGRPNDPEYAAQELARYAVAAGSSDNCSAVVVVFREEPPPQPQRPRLFGGRGGSSGSTPRTPSGGASGTP